MERYTCSWIRRINIVKMSILPKVIYGLNVISIKTPSTFFQRNRIKNSRIYRESQKTLNSQSNPEEKKKSGGIMLPNFRLYYKATEIKTAWSCTKSDTEINGTEQGAQK